MNVLRQPVPWEYQDVVLGYLRSSDVVLDIGTGGGERLGDLARSFGHGLGIDADPEMVLLATENPAAGNPGFRVCSERLESVPETFDVIIDRHAPFDLSAVAAHLNPGGYFVTQQVGDRGQRLLAFMEYDVEYVVRDIESLVFWLNALDPGHADVDGQSALASAAILNRVLAGNVDERGFVTNEHRYLAVMQCMRERARLR
jgi:SAM-dependent methyltransferase